MVPILSEITVGSLVWGTARDSNGLATTGGLVVDQLDEATLLILDEGLARGLLVQVKGSKGNTWHRLRPARLRRMALVEVDRTVPEDWVPNPSRTHGWARKALLSAAVGTTVRAGLVGDSDAELARCALSITHQSGVMGR